MKHTSHFLFILLLVFILPCCTKSDNEKCGDDVFDNFQAFENTYFDDPTRYTYTEGLNIAFMMYKTYTNVCPDEHVQVNFTGKMDPGAGTFLASASWGILWGDDIAITTDAAGNATGTLEFGLKQV